MINSALAKVRMLCEFRYVLCQKGWKVTVIHIEKNDLWQDNVGIGSGFCQQVTVVMRKVQKAYT